MPRQRAVVIVLAGQRAGVTNPLAARAGVSHKCLVPIADKPLLAHVLDALSRVEAASEIRISVEPDGQAQLRPLIDVYAARGVPLKLVTSRRNLVDSVLEAAGDDAGPFVITTADNVLLTPDAVEQVLGELTRAEGVFALAAREDVLAAHPDGQRNFYKFRGGEFANCNIYGIANRKALTRGSEIFRGGGQFMKNVGRMIAAFGLHNIALLRLGAFDLQGAMRRLSKRFGIAIVATRFADGSLAIDVDNERTYAVCEQLLAQRRSA